MRQSNPFDELCTETVTLKNSEGKLSGPFQCTLTNEQCIVFDTEFAGVEGNLLYRALPNGRVESFLIIEVQYSSGFSDEIPPSYECTLRKKGIIKDPSKVPSSTTVNIQQAETVQVGDYNSVEVSKLFLSLIEQIESADVPAEKKEEAKSLLKRALENPVVASCLGSAVGSMVSYL